MSNNREHLTKTDLLLIHGLLEKEGKYHMIGSAKWRHINRIQQKIEKQTS